MANRKIYLAASWRNTYQEATLSALRNEGHEVYDFKHPASDVKGFSWSQIDPEWRNWTPEQFKKALQSPIAQTGHKFDHDAMKWCDTGVMILPSGNSAHLEIAWIAGQGKPVCVYVPEFREAELMYLSLASNILDRRNASMLCLSMVEVLAFLKEIM